MDKLDIFISSSLNSESISRAREIHDLKVAQNNNPPYSIKMFILTLTCACGASYTYPSQYMTAYGRGFTAIVKNPLDHPALPVEMHYVSSSMPACPACIASQRTVINNAPPETP